MHDKRDDYEPIIAGRRPREPQRESAPPLWRSVLAIVAGLAVVALLAWYWLGKSSSERTAADDPTANAAPEVFPETSVAQEIAPPARDAETGEVVPEAPAPAAETAIESAPVAQSQPETREDAATNAGEHTSEDVTDIAPAQPGERAVADGGVSPSMGSPSRSDPATASVRFASPDSQVRFELRHSPDSAPLVSAKAGETIAIPPGTYRVMALGAQLEKLEREVQFDGDRPLEYTVELCAQRQYSRESVVGQSVEQRECAGRAECETLFAVLGESADELVRDRAFRAQQCARVRPGSTPDGNWTLNIRCDGAVPTTTCRVEIAEGACTYAEPPRSARGGACPRVELN